jgi:hypothetical protein
MTWEAMHKKLVLLCKYHKNSEGSMAQRNHGTRRSLPKIPGPPGQGWGTVGRLDVLSFASRLLAMFVEGVVL